MAKGNNRDCEQYIEEGEMVSRSASLAAFEEKAEGEQWQDDFLDLSYQRDPQFTSQRHQEKLQAAAPFYNLPRQEQERVILEAIEAGFEKSGMENGDIFAISANGEVYGKVVAKEDDGERFGQEPSLEIYSGGGDEEEMLAEEISPYQGGEAYKENSSGGDWISIEALILDKMFEATDYIIEAQVPFSDKR